MSVYSFLGEMAAIEISRPGEPDVLTPIKMPVPELGAGEILV
ncbi:hypothetical protein [Xenorhabdus sp. IM139775]|nr:hypothetical protein [Xenorhabdus sp. IM139775]MDC9593265.1 hypothetical protein [Xenorhabdus sp. IM139775]